jgi:hypothetical protein
VNPNGKAKRKQVTWRETREKEVKYLFNITCNKTHHTLIRDIRSFNIRDNYAFYYFNYENLITQFLKKKINHLVSSLLIEV